MLIGHLRRDGEVLISRDGGRQRGHNEINGCTGRDRDVLCPAHQTKASHHRGDTRCAWGEQTVAADAS